MCNFDNFKQFKRILMAVGADDPQFFGWLFSRIDIERRVRYCITSDGDIPQMYFFSTEKMHRHGMQESSISAGQKQMVEYFIALCREAQEGNNRNQWELQKFLRDLYHSDAARAILFLLMHSDEGTIRQFALSHLGEGVAIQMATVDIVIRKNDGLERITGNTGQYLIYTRKGKDGEEQLLKFTNQPSTVYYLMFLIHRCQENRLLPYVELRNNRDAFFELYQQVYDEHAQSILSRIQNLLFRKDRYGQIRAGRLHEIVHDIRKHLEQRFEAYGESFQPYAMTAYQHLSIGAEHIHFEGEAQQLLRIEFV